MPRAGANGIEIEYDEPGSEGDPVILLIMGLSAQLIGWDEDFVAELAGRGFRGSPGVNLRPQPPRPSSGWS